MPRVRDESKRQRRAPLTAGEVQEIRETYSTIPTEDLIAKFRTSASVVSRIICNTAYKEPSIWWEQEKRCPRFMVGDEIPFTLARAIRWACKDGMNLREISTAFPITAPLALDIHLNKLCPESERWWLRRAARGTRVPPPPKWFDPYSIPEETVKEIRERFRRHASTRTLAAEYGINRYYITKIVNNEVWEAPKWWERPHFSDYPIPMRANLCEGQAPAEVIERVGVALNGQQALAIRQSWKKGKTSTENLAYVYGVTPSTIQNVLANRTWRETSLWWLTGNEGWLDPAPRTLGTRFNKTQIQTMRQLWKDGVEVPALARLFATDRVTVGNIIRNTSWRLSEVWWTREREAA